MLKNIKKNKIVDSLLNGSNIMLFVVVIIALSVTWSSIKIIQKNYELQKQIVKLQQIVGIEEQTNKNQHLKNQYFKSDVYLDLAARKYFGKASPGENVIIVPKDIANSYVHPTNIKVKKLVKNTVSNYPQIVQNWQSWSNFFLHKQQNLD